MGKGWCCEMIKFNGEHINDAWEDYKAYLEGMGVDQKFIRMYQPHFKTGFALGEAFAKGQQVQPVVRVRKHSRPNGKGQKRYKKEEGITVNVRTEEVRNKQEQLLLFFLKDNIRAMELSEIISFMVRSGFTDWNSKNASSYLVTLMKGHPGKVSKVSRGLYQYTGGQVL